MARPLMMRTAAGATQGQKTRRRFGINFVDPDLQEDSRKNWTEPRKYIDDILSLQRTDWFLTGLILLSFIVIVIEANLTGQIMTEESTANLSESGISGKTQQLLLVDIATKAFTSIYFLEMCARLFVYRKDFVRGGWGFDGAIVFIDVLMTVLDAVFGNHPSLSFFRVFRLARLLRFVRILNMFPELSFLLRGMASSMRAIIFGTILVYIMITMWAVVGVYWIHPVNIRVIEEGGYEDGDRSPRAWSSVQNSMLTLAQTVIFGDSWGASAILIIEESPDTLLFFIAMYSTVALATLNLILAAIVDSGAQAREEAMEERKRKKDASMSEENKQKQEYLLQVCSRLDDDDSGSLSMAEIQAGFDGSKEFNCAMEEFELDRRYIDIFFNAMDPNGNGAIDYHEFIRLVNMSRTQASQNVLTFVKFAIIDARKMIAHSQTTLMQEIASLKQIALDGTSSDAGSLLSQEQKPGKGASKGGDKQQAPERRNSLCPPGQTNGVSMNGQTNGVSMKGQTNGVITNGQSRHTEVGSLGKSTSAPNSQSRRRSTNGQIQRASIKDDSRPAKKRSPSPSPEPTPIVPYQSQSPSPPEPDALDQQQQQQQHHQHTLAEGPLKELVKLSREVADGMKCLLAGKGLLVAEADCELPKLPSEDDTVGSPNRRSRRGLLLLESLEATAMEEDALGIISMKC